MARKNSKTQPEEPKTDNPAVTETAPAEKLFKPEPIRRGRARDYSHWQQNVQVTLKTDTAQRFLERHFNSTNETLQYLDYMLVILRDDAFAKPLAEELAGLFPGFMSEAHATAGKLKKMADAATLPFTVQGTTYDNARTYEAALLSGNSVDMLAAITALDALAVTIDEVRGKRVITTFDRKNLLEMWVDALTQRTKRVRAIAGAVRDKNNELRKAREEKQAKELEERNRERARAEEARNTLAAESNTAPAADTPAESSVLAEPPAVISIRTPAPDDASSENPETERQNPEQPASADVLPAPAESAAEPETHQAAHGAETRSEAEAADPLPQAPGDEALPETTGESSGKAADAGLPGSAAPAAQDLSQDFSDESDQLENEDAAEAETPTTDQTEEPPAAKRSRRTTRSAKKAAAG